MKTRDTNVILCNFIKGGAGKTTLAVHITGILIERTASQVLLIDCDPRPDSWRFFSGSRPPIGSTRLSLHKGVDLWWNPPQPKGSRFKPLTKRVYEDYDYIVIDADSPPEDSLTILSDALPDIFLLPIAESQSHAIEDIQPFIRDLEREIRFEKDSGIDYNPIIKVVPLGISPEEIEPEIDVNEFRDVEVRICSPMRFLASEVRRSLKERILIWNYPDLEDMESYFVSLIQDEIREVQ
ncbi:ParA family protein [bacterium]|nr:ParA family protein [bacterium]